MTPDIDVVVDIPATNTASTCGQRDDISVPPVEMIVSWAAAALEEEPVDALSPQTGASLCIRIVGRQEMQSLNSEFADKQYPTNVLSFPMNDAEFTHPEGSGLFRDASIDHSLMHEFPERILGDIAICAQIVNDEAREQSKTPYAHWAHMVVHGVLHLRGFDHQKEEQANIMEQTEKDILATLGFADPYKTLEDVTLRSGNPLYGG